MMEYGYIRVSSRDQNEARQLIAMHEFGIPDQHIYRDKQSGKNFNRAAWKKMMRRLNGDDVLVVQSIDRMGRNYEEIIEQWRIITKIKEAAIVVLDMPLLDTRKERDLTGRLIADIVLQLLSYVAQTEREKIRQRQAEGIAAAQARGVRFGRPHREKPDNFRDIANRWHQKELTLNQAADMCNLPKSTFYDWARAEVS